MRFRCIGPSGWTSCHRSDRRGVRWGWWNLVRVVAHETSFESMGMSDLSRARVRDAISL
ncbi:hypothetical protein ACFFX0_15515 [Citricoccus parietis]|uniref:Uncharacterized protein n=1 Tax=Citricoccus parietis TaxID=592307 RepID=A0ABV5G0U8_9MICC